MSGEAPSGRELENPEREQRVFDESDLVPISRLADLEFCERRAALHLIEMAWEDNIHTAAGSVMHEHAHGDDLVEKRGNTVIVRGLWLRSMRLGLSGKADILELHRVDDCDTAGTSIHGHQGHWRVYPVEYKPGRLKQQRSFQIQLCAQALCLEEMLNTNITSGAIYYGKTRRRLEIVFDTKLRQDTEMAIQRLHELIRSGVTPPAEYSKKCKNCSLIDSCLPKTTGRKGSVENYLKKVVANPP